MDYTPSIGLKEQKEIARKLLEIALDIMEHHFMIM